MSSLRRNISTAIAALFIATPLIAQETMTVADTAQRNPPSVASSIAAPVASSVIVIDRAPSMSSPSWVSALTTAPASTRQLAVVRSSDSGSQSQSTAMMILGGAGLLVGAIIGGKSGTIIMVGGGVVGLVGLWDYLR